MTELVARQPVPRPGALLRLSRASVGAVVLGLVAVGLVHALDTTSLPFALALAGGLALTGFLLLAVRHYDTAIAIALLLMGVVRFEPAPPDIAFAVIVSVAAMTGRFRLNRVPLLLRWIVGLFLIVNVLSMVDVKVTSGALRFLLITVYLAIFSLWLAGYVDSPSRSRTVVMTWLGVGAISAVVSVLANDVMGRGRTWAAFWVLGAAVALNLGLNLVAVPRFGATGAR